MADLRYGTITRQIGRQGEPSPIVLVVHTEKGLGRSMELTVDQLLDIIVKASALLRSEIGKR